MYAGAPTRGDGRPHLELDPQEASGSSRSTSWLKRCRAGRSSASTTTRMSGSTSRITAAMFRVATSFTASLFRSIQPIQSARPLATTWAAALRGRLRKAAPLARVGPGALVRAPQAD